VYPVFRFSWRQEWLIAVALTTDVPQPLEEITAFGFGNYFIKLNQGTWHAGPYFDDEFVDFYNLELSDTNINDHHTYNFGQRDSLELEIVCEKASLLPALYSWFPFRAKVSASIITDSMWSGSLTEKFPRL